MAGLDELDLAATARERVGRDGHTVTNVHRLFLAGRQIAQRSSRTCLYSHVLVGWWKGEPAAVSWHTNRADPEAIASRRHADGVRVIEILDEGRVA